MSNVELKHTLTVDRNAWFVRFYVWLWEASPADITFCKLFWGYVFALPGLVLRFAIFEPLEFALAPLVKRAEQRKRQREDQKLAELRAEAPPAPRPRRMQRVLGRIAHSAARVGFMGSATWHFVSKHKRLNRWLLRGAVAVGLLASAAGVVVIVYIAVTNLSTTGVILLGVLSFALVVVMVAALVAFGVLEAIWYRVLTPAGHGTKAGALGFFGVMGHGYRAVKSNTCPRIELRDEDAT